MLTYILLIIGFVFLIKGASFLVDGASSLAHKFGISNLVIGLTIVAFGTSAPELFVNLFAAWNGNAEIAMSNIIGSNIVNIFFILGITAIIHPLKVTKGTVWKEIPLSILAVVIILIAANDTLFISELMINELSRGDGLVLISFFVIFLFYIFSIAKITKSDEENISKETKERKIIISIGMIILGLIGLIIGGQWIVDGAVKIAKLAGLSEAFIGLTIVAIGTSLPEFATSIVAALKKNSDIAIGNIVGSNIFNIFWILGLTATIRPLPISSLAVNFDLGIALLGSLLLFIWMFIGRKHQLERWQGWALVSIYIGYIIYIIMRG